MRKLIIFFDEFQVFCFFDRKSIIISIVNNLWAFLLQKISWILDYDQLWTNYGLWSIFHEFFATFFLRNRFDFLFCINEYLSLLQKKAENNFLSVFLRFLHSSYKCNNYLLTQTSNVKYVIGKCGFDVSINLLKIINTLSKPSLRWWNA